MINPVDLRRSAPSVQRNRAPLLDVLRDILPPSGLVLEVASGTGEHVVHFAQNLPELQWQPSDASPEARLSIDAWSKGLNNVQTAVELDAARDDWPVTKAAAVICSNMIHISPWDATVGLMHGARAILPIGGIICLYGPFRRADRLLEPGNAAFDLDLRARDPAWGLRDLEAVIACAAGHDLRFDRVINMPADNLSVIFRRL